MSSPTFSSSAPAVLNSANKVSVSLPVANVGTGVASQVIVNKITLGSALRITPTAFPGFMGDLGVGQVMSVNAAFSTAGLSVGSKCLLTVSGRYVSNGTTYGFAVNRPFAVPAPVAPPIAVLAALVQVVVNLSAGTWSYTVLNNELFATARFINAISLDLAAPISAATAPTGWNVLTDNLTSVLWYAADQQHQIAPGSALTGFQIQSGFIKSETRGVSITSWNQQTNNADLVGPADTLTPSNRT